MRSVGSRILEITVDEMVLVTHVLPSDLSIEIEVDLILCSTQLLKDSLHLCRGRTHDHTTLANPVAFCVVLPAFPSHKRALW